MQTSRAYRSPLVLLIVSSLLGLAGCENDQTPQDNVVPFDGVLGAVIAYYPAAPNWNDYVKNDGVDQYSASNTAAVGDEAPHFTSVIHGGEFRKVDITGISSCDGITAIDALDAWNWQCRPGSPARMVSLGLKADKHLSSLIDFTGAAWLPNQLEVYKDGALYGTTPSTAWWTNPIRVDNDGSNGSDQTAGEIVLITADQPLTYNFGADKVAIVIQPGFTVGSYDSGPYPVQVLSRKYTWLEGRVTCATGVNYGVYYSNSSFTTVRNLEVHNCPARGITLDFADGNRFIDVKVSYAGIGLRASTSNGNLFQNIYASKNGGSSSINIRLSSNNVFQGLTSVNSFGMALYVNSTAVNTTFADLTLATSPDGLVMSVSSSSNFMTSATFANNDSRGVSYGSSSYEATLMNAVAANSLYGFDINMQNGVFYNLAAVHQESIGVYLPSSTNLDNVFLGEILTGANASFDCWVLAAPSPGMDDDSNVLDVDTDSVHSGECHSQGGSDFVHVAAADLTNSFVGKLLADDLVNSNDVAGAAGTYPADPVAFDWVGFENPYRGWGIDGSAFPNIDNQSQWTTGAGRIWDWRLRDTDTQLRNKNALPTGAVALSQVWNGTPGTSDDAGCNLMVRGSKWDATNGVCRSAFLENAYEILNDRVGNDNNLCEAGETCLFTPNMASYQGHGNLVSAGQVSFDGGVVELVQYETNGVP